MKTSKLIMFFAFVFCISLSQTATAAVSQSNDVLTTAVTKNNQKLNVKNLKKSIDQKFKKVKKDVKKILKDQKENASVGKLLLVALVGLAFIGLGALLNIGFFGWLGGIFITIAIVWWVLQLIGVL